MKNEKRMKGFAKPEKKMELFSLSCYAKELFYLITKKERVLKFEFDSNIFIRLTVSSSEKGKYNCLMISE